MSEIFTVSRDEIIQQIKISCQIPSVVEGILSRKIIARAAAEAGIIVSPEELQQTADSLRLINKLETAEATWSWLLKYNLSLDDFEELVYATVISSKLAQHLFAEQVESFFVEHQLNYSWVIMYEIVLDDEDLAMELFYALQEGESSFSNVAHQYIQDTELRRSGGYRGRLNRTELKPEISAAVFAATPPQILKPIVTSSGVHLIWVEEVIQPQLDEMLHQKILSDLFSFWLKQQLAQFSVELD
ncbi:MAG TPA: peptidylprolyl isomerase [Cyanobacteria bacterium UBA12227]|nr:peptidylprolyl isomerase [Cyanobacteria bacterium UBA12227]HAX89324.1 peptidylprolyl isomerase [Cyanobacteria bacterium UBA11370]HBY77013.1 peptidylprolyl isomerase [Cyanobacteria bacterium UBA11148]